MFIVLVKIHKYVLYLKKEIFNPSKQGDPIVEQESTNKNTQNLILFILRVSIGLHLFYEGVSKLFQPEWTAAGFLSHSKWIFADIFQWIATQPTLMQIVDLLNIWGLILIGLGLILGYLTRIAAISGMGLLFLYYVAYPPFGGFDFGVPTEGHYLIVNKNLIELIALGVLAVFARGETLGLDRLLVFLKSNRKAKDKLQPAEKEANKILTRREIIRNLASLPLLGIFGGLIYKDKAYAGTDAFSGATIKFKTTLISDLKGDLPKSKIVNLNVSRVILGGNLIGGYAHARDLIYSGDLFRAYNTEKKIFETLMLCESTGVNTIIGVPWQLEVINKYKKLMDGKIQSILMINSIEEIQKAMDGGADAMYIIGNHCDWQVRAGKVDELAKLIDYIKEQGYPAGLGAHSIQALIACNEGGIDPDFYVKTLHNDNYWSAHPRENRIPFSVDGEKSLDHNQFHDNMFCLFPEKTIAFMEAQDKPWIAFKVLAAGAIHPKEAFKYAFENGADFLCVGMFDFQVVEDVNIATETLINLGERPRRWLASV
jgi:uncharacterized membrane protein YphA (DoxX/SURF4 family)